MEFCSLSSGSSGNCYYLGVDDKHGILIDAGISAKSIKNFLKSIGVSIETIMGIIITHNHGDHIKGLQTLTKKYHIPVFTSKTVWENILKNKSQKEIAIDCIRYITLEKVFSIAGLSIEAFPVSHDTPETLGFHIFNKNKKITVVTDLGYICENAAKYIKAANFLVIESNYDKKMLTSGTYPYFLKERIIGKCGHLDNFETATFLAENMNNELSHICLAHLSKDNNTPEIALQVINTKLSENGSSLNCKPKISVLNRNIPSELICFD